MDTSEIVLLMERNLSEVFGERDAVRRKTAITELFAEDCAFYDAEGQSIGRAAVDVKAGSILDQSPADFGFRVVGSVDAIHDMGRLQWQFGFPDAPPVVTGMDIALFDNGKIQTLYTFIDTPDQNRA